LFPDEISEVTLNNITDDTFDELPEDTVDEASEDALVTEEAAEDARNRLV